MNIAGYFLPRTTLAPQEDIEEGSTISGRLQEVHTNYIWGRLRGYFTRGLP